MRVYLDYSKRQNNNSQPYINNAYILVVCAHTLKTQTCTHTQRKRVNKRLRDTHTCTHIQTESKRFTKAVNNIQLQSRITIVRHSFSIYINTYIQIHTKYYTRIFLTRCLFFYLILFAAVTVSLFCCLSVCVCVFVCECRSSFIVHIAWTMV